MGDAVTGLDDVSRPPRARRPSGSYDWTKRSSASRISSGRIVSSAIVSSVSSGFA